MASGDDPLADMQNILGYQGLVGPNPYDPFPLGNQTQTGIPFSGGAGPGVGFMAGWPTDAMGNPIQPQAGSGIPSPGSAQASPAAVPGTTINSPPAAGMSFGQPGTNPLATAAAAGATPQQLGQMFSQMSPTIPSYTDTGGFGGQAVMGPGTTPNPAYQRVMGQMLASAYGAPAAPAAASAAMGPSGLTRPQYLSLLAHPGPVPTYGAAPPQAGQTPTGSPPPNVMQAYLATQAGKNTPFVNTLNKLQGATS